MNLNVPEFVHALQIFEAQKSPAIHLELMQ
jgi:hypothetical protein